jgi:hypothetical protein
MSNERGLIDMTGRKIERYSLSTDPIVLVLGEAKNFELVKSTEVPFQAECLSINVPSWNFVKLRSAIVDGKEVLGDSSFVDARLHAPDSTPILLKVRPLCRRGFSVRGEYTGYIPIGYKSGARYPLIISVRGPAGKSLANSTL